MTTINSVIELQIILALLMICGIVLTKKRVLTADGRKCLTDLLIDLILPCNIINSFLIDLSSEVLIASLEVLLIALGIQILCWLGGKILFSLPNREKRRCFSMRRSVRMQDLWEIRLLKGSMDRRDCCTHPAAFL